MPRRRTYKTNAARQAAYRKRKREARFGNNVEWGTPPEIFRWLDKEFGFTLDVCASADNAKCERFYTKQDDALTQDWIGICWCNPPDTVTEVERWVRKAYDSSLSGATVVCLVPAQTDRDWFHDWALRKAEIRFLLHRLWFEGGRGGHGTRGHYPYVVLVYRPTTVNLQTQR